MNLLGAVLKESLYIVFKLCTTNDRVIAEYHALIFQQRRVRYQLHLSHQRTALLIARSKRTRPCWSVLQHSTLVGHALSFSISQRHTYSRIRYTAYAVYIGLILLTHHLSVGLANVLNVYSVIVRCRESVINPQERANLLSLPRLLQHLHLVGCQENYLAWSKVANSLIIQIWETGSLAAHSICTFLLTDYYRCTAQEIACSNDTLLSKYQH